MADYFEQFKEINPSEIPRNGNDYFSRFQEMPSQTKGRQGIAEDIQRKTFQGVMAVPEVAQSIIQKGPSELAGAAQQIAKFPYEVAKGVINPMRGKTEPLPRMTQNVIGGALGMGSKLMSLPANLRDYLAEKEVIPQSTPSFRLPGLDENANYPELMGRTGKQSGDILMENFAAALPGSRAASEFAQRIPLTKGIASRPLRKATKAVERLGTGPLNMPQEMITQAQAYLPESLANQRLFEAAKTGDYNPLFNVQSDLAARARELQKFPSTGGERLLGRDIGKFRQEFIGHMKRALEEQGNKEAAELLGQGQERYRRYSKQTPYRKAAIGFGLGAGALEISPEARKILAKIFMR